MTKKKKQHILCYVDFSGLGDNLVPWIKHLKEHFDNPVDFLFVIDHNTESLFGKHYTRTDIEEQLSGYRKQCGSPAGTDYIREGCNCSMLSQLAEETDAAFCVSAVHSRNDVQFLSSSALVKMLRNSRIPCLVIPKRNVFSPPEVVSLGINMKKEQKTVSPWLTFMANRLDIPVKLYYNKEEEAVKNNLGFIRKLLENHNIKSEYELVKKHTASIDRFCLENRKKSAVHCLYLNSSAGFASKLTGDQDAKMIDRSAGHAVFCVNPREDLFIPCV